jgi:hypothetical protein
MRGYATQGIGGIYRIAHMDQWRDRYREVWSAFPNVSCGISIVRVGSGEVHID